MGFDSASMGAHFGDAQEEAIWTREACCVFDFSFLSRARVEGPDSLSVVSRLTSRRLDDLQVGKVRYALRTDDAGRVTTDLTIWRTREQCYEVFSGAPQDLDALQPAGQSVVKVDRDPAVLALQGPGSLSAFSALCDVTSLARLRYYECCEVVLLGCRCLVGRLGYTGEAGFEIVADRASRAHLWQALCRVARPAGFEAANILRIEAGFPLFTNEFAVPIFPDELGMGRFGGSPAAGREDGIRIAAFVADQANPDRDPFSPASNARPTDPGEIVVTSVCRSPRAKGVLGLGFVRSGDAGRISEVWDRTNTYSNIRLAQYPFYDPKKLRPRSSW